jgi:hypothetical protein
MCIGSLVAVSIDYARTIAWCDNTITHAHLVLRSHTTTTASTIAHLQHRRQQTGIVDLKREQRDDNEHA